MRNLWCLLVVLTQLLAAPPAMAVDINGQLKKAQLEKLSSDPTGSEARIYWNTSSLVPKIYNGTSWLSLYINGATGLFANGTVSAPSIAFNSDADGTGTGIYRIGADNLGFAANGVIAGSYSSAGFAIKGTNTNDSASAGYVGEYKQNYRSVDMPNFLSATYTSVDASSSTFNDGAETGITLTAGDWDIDGSVFFIAAATTTVTDMIAGIGTAPGNSATGLDINNESRLQASMATATNSNLVVPTFRVSLSGNQTYYLKARATFATSTLTARGIIRARRIR